MHMEKTPRNLMASDDPPKIVVFAVSAVRCQDPAMANSSFGLMMLFFPRLNAHLDHLVRWFRSHV